MAWPWVVGPLISLLLLPYLYIRLNDRRLTHIPKSALAFSPVRYTVEDVRKTTARLLESPISTADQIPPKTGRRYIIVGGVNRLGPLARQNLVADPGQAGFVGGWIVLQLLERGEDPKRIRVVDIRAPVRPDLTTGLAKNVDFIQADVTDPAAVDAAFNAPWPNDASPVSAAPQISIFHTVANIRAYERSESLLVNSTKVNVVGTHNIIDAARNVGATALVCTSSGSVSVRSTRFLLWPWETEPKLFVQAINDDEALIPKRHYDFFSNYAVSKIAAEREVCAADKTPSRDGKVLRTGCVRPANGIFGPGGDTICGDYLVRKVNPSWIHSMVGNFIYVENAALAHLLYEQRLIELSNGGTNPDIGGQAFIVTDPNPPPTNGDVYLTLSTLTDGETKFPWLSPTFIIFLGYLIEWYYLARLSLGSRIAKKLPAITGDIVNLQPALFNLVNVHLFFDDSRARLAPEKGGLGYKGAWSTFEGVHKTVDEYKAAVLRSETKAFRRHLV